MPNPIPSKAILVTLIAVAMVVLIFVATWTFITQLR